MRTIVAIALVALVVAVVSAAQTSWFSSKCKDSCIAKALETRSLLQLRDCISRCRTTTLADEEVEQTEEQKQWSEMSSEEFASMTANMAEAISTELESAEQQVMADAESETEAPTTYCLKSGLNYRSSACGALAGTTSGSVQARNLNERVTLPNCNLGANLEWIKVEISGRAVWVANLAGMLSDCSTPSQPTGNGVSVTQLRSIMPNLPLSTANAYIGGLNGALTWGNILSCPRKAAFLAQLAHESVQLRYMEEIASGAAYEGRRDLGNIYPGDGKRYKGRGPIQLTGRANYRAAGSALGVDLEGNPTLAATPQWGFKIAAWFWNSRGLSASADKNTQAGFDYITYRINGGYNGKADRDAYWRKAKSVLGC